MKVQKGRKVYLDILRIIASVAVMILHISAQNWHNQDVTGLEWNALNFYDSIVRWGVPVFIMISGVLFLNGNQSLERIFRKNILRIVTAFIFWSCFYAGISYLRGASVREALQSFLRGHYHMWFLPMIVGIYLMVPLLRAVAKDEFLTKYFLILSLLFTFLIPQTVSVLNVLHNSYGTFADSVLKKVELHLVLGYTPYFVLGYYLDRTVLSKRTSKMIRIAGVFGFAATVVLSSMISRHIDRPEGLFYGNMTLNVLAEAIFVFTVCKDAFEYRELSDKAKSIIFALSKLSFGAYLVHPFVIDQLDRRFGLNTLSFHPALAVPVIAIIVAVVSYLISWIINRIPVLNRYIV